MKNILITIFTLLSFVASSQVIIGNDVGTAQTKTGVLLEFAANQNKGIILPYVRTLPTGPGLAEGTILVNATDPTSAKVQLYKGTWQDLSSGNGANITSQLAIQPTGVTENPSSKAIIGSRTTSADGVLVLESDTKAMILPTVQSTNDIPSPAAGMMVYVNRIGGKRLAVYNGSVWTYWKP